MLSYNEVKKFEAGSTFRWAASIVGGPGPVSDAALNMLGGKFLPATKIEISDIEVKNTEVKVTPDFSLKIPYISIPVESVEITIEDNKAGAIRAEVLKWATQNKLPNGRAVDIKNFYKLLKIEIFNPDYSVAYSRTLYIVPDGKIMLSRDSEISSDNYPITFTVVGQD